MASSLNSHPYDAVSESLVCPHALPGWTISVNSANAVRAHAEGIGTIASGEGSHAEGNCTKASGPYSHAEGSSENLTSSEYQKVSFLSLYGNGTAVTDLRETVPSIGESSTVKLV